MQIVRAAEADHTRLTEIAFAAKRFWHYPEEYYDIWRDELTITPEYIRRNDVFSALIDRSAIAGFYSVTFCEQETYLDHILIDPSYHKQGIGSALIKHVIRMQKEKGVTCIKAYVDPNASGFYDKIGAKQIGVFQSNIQGRVIPVYQIST